VSRRTALILRRQRGRRKRIAASGVRVSLRRAGRVERPNVGRWLDWRRTLGLLVERRRSSGRWRRRRRWKRSRPTRSRRTWDFCSRWRRGNWGSCRSCDRVRRWRMRQRCRRCRPMCGRRALRSRGCGRQLAGCAECRQRAVEDFRVPCSVGRDRRLAVGSCHIIGVPTSDRLATRLQAGRVRRIRSVCPGRCARAERRDPRRSGGSGRGGICQPGFGSPRRRLRHRLTQFRHDVGQSLPRWRERFGRRYRRSGRASGPPITAGCVRPRPCGPCSGAWRRSRRDRGREAGLGDRPALLGLGCHRRFTGARQTARCLRSLTWCRHRARCVEPGVGCGAMRQAVFPAIFGHLGHASRHSRRQIVCRCCDRLRLTLDQGGYEP